MFKSLILFFALFPYIQPFVSVSDVGPYWLLYSTFYFILSRKTLNSNDLLLFSIPFLCFAFGLDNLTQDIRGFVPSFSFVLALVLGAKTQFHDSYLGRFLFVTLCIYIAAGLIQLYINPNAFVYLSSRDFGYAGRGGRGVESLTAEPTFLGFLSLIFLFVSANIVKLRRVNISLSLFLLIFISRSSSALASLILVSVFVGLSYLTILTLQFFYKLRVSPKFFVPLIFGLLVLFFVYSFAGNFRNIRFFAIIDSGLSFKILTSWPSINDRLTHIFGSFYMSFENFLLPNGYTSFKSNIVLLKDKFDWIGVIGGADGRIMSFNGSFVYELGFLSVFLLFSFYNKIYRLASVQFNSSLVTSFFVLGVFLVMMQAIPIGLPTLPFLLGLLLVKRND